MRTHCKSAQDWIMLTQPMGFSFFHSFTVALVSSVFVGRNRKKNYKPSVKKCHGCHNNCPVQSKNRSFRKTYSGRLTSGSLPGQAVPGPFCQRSKDEGKLRLKFTKCEKINIFEHATGFRPPVAMAKPKWRQILLSWTLFSNVTSKEGKPMSCACSVFIPVKRMGICNFSPMG